MLIIASSDNRQLNLPRNLILPNVFTDQ